MAALCAYEVARVTVNGLLDEDVVPSAVTLISGLSVRRVVRGATPEWLRVAGMMAGGAALGAIGVGQYRDGRLFRGPRRARQRR